MSIDSVFDTVRIADEHIPRSIIPIRKLGHLVRRMGLDPRYISGGLEDTRNLFANRIDRQTFLAKVEAAAGAKGLHNASNDAAYTMMAMLLFVLRWDEVARRQLRKIGSDDPLWERALLPPEGSVDVSEVEESATGDETAAGPDTFLEWSWWNAALRSLGRLFRSW